MLLGYEVAFQAARSAIDTGEMPLATWELIELLHRYAIRGGDRQPGLVQTATHRRYRRQAAWR